MHASDPGVGLSLTAQINSAFPAASSGLLASKGDLPHGRGAKQQETLSKMLLALFLWPRILCCIIRAVCAQAVRLFPDSRKYVFAVSSRACSGLLRALHNAQPQTAAMAQKLCSRSGAMHSTADAVFGGPACTVALHCIFVEGPAPVNDGRHMPWQVACTGRWDVDSYALQRVTWMQRRVLQPDGAVWQDSTWG